MTLTNRNRSDYLEIVSAASQEPNDPCLQFMLNVLYMNCAKVKQCLDVGVNSNIAFADESTALHIAADNENINMLHLLLTYPETNPNLQDAAGKTPLNIAAKHGNKNIALLLIQYNADVDKFDRFHFTPLHTAVLNGHEGVVDILLDNGANPNILDSFGRSPLYLAAKEVIEIDTVRKLLSHQADPNLYSTAYTMPLLMECCLTCQSEDQLQIIIILIEHGAKVNEIYPITRRTALHIAAFTGYEALVKTLLKYGAKKEIVDVRKMTPFLIAKEQHHKSLIKYLKPNIEWRFKPKFDSGASIS